MRIITETTLKQAYQKYPDAESGIRAWKKLVKEHKWDCFTDVKNTSLFAPDKVKNLVVFNIGGNKYRLITCIDYRNKKIYIRNFLSHNEYDTNKWQNDEWFDS